MRDHKHAISGIQKRCGSILIYSFFMMAIMMGFISLGVDFGRMETVKTEEQRCADATARSALQMYQIYGSGIAVSYAPYLASNTYNPVDSKSGVTATVAITWGSYNSSTKTFIPGGTTPVAVKVVISRTAATGNAVPLTFPLMNGLSAVRTTCDVWASAIAVLQPSTTTTTTVAGTSDIWLSNMPAGSNAGWSDSPANAPSTLVMNVTPGTVLSFGATGSTMYNGVVSTMGPDGAAYNTSHMSGSPDGNYNGLQNGIQSITAPQNALIGVFLTNAAPNTVTPPASAADYSTNASQNQASYSNLQVQQPFFIGDGQASGGVVQSFVVPAGATRLYMGVFDGWQNWDNPGSLSVTTTQQALVYLVK